MQTDALLPKGEQRGYTSVSHALTTIVRGEGVAGLFKVRGEIRLGLGLGLGLALGLGLGLG